MNTKPWYKQKTTRTGIATLLTAVASYLTGTGDPALIIEAGIVLMGIFLRQGVEKNK
jgi:hypothetical protein